MRSQRSFQSLAVCYYNKLYSNLEHSEMRELLNPVHSFFVCVIDS